MEKSETYYVQVAAVGPMPVTAKSHKAAALAVVGINDDPAWPVKVWSEADRWERRAPHEWRVDDLVAFAE